MAQDPAGVNVLQAMMVSVFGILILIIQMFAFSPIIDLFTDLATSLEIDNPSMLLSMSSMVKFSDWIYIIVAIVGITMFVYPIIVVVKKHRYVAVDTQQSQMNDENRW